MMRRAVGVSTQKSCQKSTKMNLYQPRNDWFGSFRLRFFQIGPGSYFGAQGVVKMGFLAKKYSDFKYFHAFSTDFWKSWYLKIVICLKLVQKQVFEGFWDDLEAGIGISMKKGC